MTISLIYSYLRYDAEQLMERYSAAWYENPTERFNANLRSTEPDEADLIRRLVTTACSRLRTELHKYLHHDTGDADDTLRTDKSIEYRFKRANTSGQALADLMHWCVVRLAMSAWCKMQGRYNEANNEAAEAGELLSSMLNKIRSSSMPVKDGKTQPIPEDIIYIHYGQQED